MANLKETKTRISLTIEKEHKKHLEREASKLGLNLNSIIIYSCLKQFPLEGDNKEK